MDDPSFVKIRDRLEATRQGPRQLPRLRRMLDRLPRVPAREHVVVVALVGLGVAVLAVTWVRTGSREFEPLPRPEVEDSGTAQTAVPGAAAGGVEAGAGEGAISVHVAGAVVSPGVYDLDAGGRAIDAIRLAGGPVPGADVSALNLAAKLADGQRIFVPMVGEGTQDPAQPQAPGQGDLSTGGLVNLNTAGAAELDELPGIGEKTADAIVEYRARNGPFEEVADLLDVPGVGEGKLARLEGLVTV